MAAVENKSGGVVAAGGRIEILAINESKGCGRPTHAAFLSFCFSLLLPFHRVFLSGTDGDISESRFLPKMP